MSNSEFTAQFDKLAGGKAFEQSYFDESVPFAAQLRSRLTKVSESVKKSMGAFDIPEPGLLISKTRDANAFVFGLSVCMKMEIKIKSLAKNKFRQDDFRSMRLVPDSRGFKLDQSGDEPCLRLEGEDLSALKELLKRHEYTFFDKKCDITATSPVLTFACEWTGPEVVAHQLVLSRTIPFVTVTAGLIASLDSFEQLDAVIAHELGHYYLGHSFPLTRPGSFFYRADVQTMAFRPPADSSLEHEGRRLLGIGNLRDGRSLPGFFEMPFEAEIMLSSMINLVHEKRLALAEGKAKVSFDKKCEKLAYDILQGGFYNRAHDEYLYAAELKPAAEAEWRSIFGSVKTCLGKTAPKDGDANFLKYFSGQGIGQRLKYLIGDFQPDSSPNAWTAYRKLTPVIEKNLRDIHAGETIRQIGYYTPEEEADVFAVNYLRLVGRPQSDLQDSLANMMRSSLKNGRRHGIDSEKCLEAYENGWQLDGQPYRPLPVDFKDDHHDFCFRLHSLDNIYTRLGIYPELNNTKILNTSNYQPLKTKFKEIIEKLTH